MMVMETNNLMTYAVASEKYENTLEIFEFLIKTIGNVIISIIIQLDTIKHMVINSWNLTPSRHVIAHIEKFTCWRLVKTLHIRAISHK